MSLPIRCLLPLLLVVPGCLLAQQAEMKPFTMDWRSATAPSADLGFLLDAPAGKAGFITAKNGHLAKPNGERLRLWGINCSANGCLPAKEDAPALASYLARFGI